MLIAIAAAGLAVVGAGAEQKAPAPTTRPWKPIATVDLGRLREASGIVASRRDPGYFWAHGDSGTAPVLVAFDLTGKAVAEVELAGAPNTDWEDIAADDQGHLYVGDIGNNTRLLPARYIYQIDEPDPLAPPDGPIRPKARWRFKYPAGTPRLDFESLAWRAGRFYLIPRETGPKTTLYTLDLSDDGNAALREVAELPVFSAAGADFSPDGRRLAVCTISALWVFPVVEESGGIRLEKPQVVTFPATGSVEACCFAAGGVVLLNEAKGIYRIEDEELARPPRFTRP